MYYCILFTFFFLTLIYIYLLILLYFIELTIFAGGPSIQFRAVASVRPNTGASMLAGRSTYRHLTQFPRVTFHTVAFAVKLHSEVRPDRFGLKVGALTPVQTRTTGESGLSDRV